MLALTSGGPSVGEGREGPPRPTLFLQLARVWGCPSPSLPPECLKLHSDSLKAAVKRLHFVDTELS